MATNLTGRKIRDSYNQLLHVDGGPAASEKVVYSGTGVATALRVGTGSASVDNLRLDGNTLSATNTNGSITLAPNGTGSVIIPKGQFTTLEGATLSTTGATAHLDMVGTTLTADGTNTNIDITLTPKGTGSVIVPKMLATSLGAATLSTTGAAAHLDLAGTTLTADGTDTNIDINLTPKGTGEVNVTNIDILSGKVPFSTITSRAFAAFSDVTDQVGSTSTPAAVKFGTVEVAGSGITMVTDGTNLTRLTFAAAGTYAVTPNLQIANSDGSDHALSVWFALNGVNIPRSTTRISVPKLSEGGVTFFQIVFYVTVTAGQYVQLFWLPSNTAITLDHIPAVVGPPAVPAAPSAIISAERIA